MFNLINMELYKLKHNTSFKSILSIVGCFSILIALLMLDSNSDKMFAKDVLSMTFKDQPLSTILIAIFAGLFMGSEFTNKTITHEIVCGHSRFGVIVSKTIGFFIGTTAILLIYPIICISILMFVNGWGEPFTFNSLLTALRITSLGIIVNLSIMSICVLLAFMLKDVGKVIGVSTILLMFTGVILKILSAKYHLVKVIYDYTPFNQINIVTKNILSISEIMTSLITSFSTIVLFLSIAYLLFRKAELK